MGVFTLGVHTPAPATSSVSTRVFIPRNSRPCRCSECDSERGAQSGLPAAGSQVASTPTLAPARPSSLQGSPSPQRSDSAAMGSTVLVCAASSGMLPVPLSAPPPLPSRSGVCSGSVMVPLISQPWHLSWAPPPSRSVFRVCMRHSSLPTQRSLAPLTTRPVFPLQPPPRFPRPTRLPACHPVQMPRPGTGRTVRPKLEGVKYSGRFRGCFPVCSVGLR